MTTTNDLIAAACPRINKLGSAYYFTPETIAVGAGLGLDRGQFYFLGRGGVLGDVEPLTVFSTFGYFNPAVVAYVWNASKAIVDPRLAARAFLNCAADHGRRLLAGVEGLGAFNACAEKIVAAAAPEGLTLFAAIAAEPLVDDAPGRTMQLISLLRELRGSAHLVALVATGLSSKTAHYISRPDDVALFGWAPADAPTITDEDLSKKANAEALTDALVAPAYGALDEAEAASFVHTLVQIEHALTTA